MTAPEQSAVTIRPMRDGDWPAVQRIYREGIATGHATFESQAPDWERFNSSRLPGHRLVAETAVGRIIGWAAVSPVSARPVYSGVVEHSVYIAAEARGLGLGAGERLLDGVANLKLEPTEVSGTRLVTHVRYQVIH